MEITYQCQICRWVAPKDYPRMLCRRCNGDMRPKDFNLAITGTRDSFGIGKAFIDPKTHKVIDNFKSWERAGYRDPLDHFEGDIKEGIKRKIEKIKKYDSGKRTSVLMKGAN